MKKHTIQSAHNKLWKTFSEYIRRRDMGRCFSCGKLERWNEGSQAGHYIHGGEGSKYNPLHFDERNVHAQCARCNKHLRGNPREYAYHLVARYGNRVLKTLHKARWSGERLTVEQMLKMELKYKKKLIDLPL